MVAPGSALVVAESADTSRSGKGMVIDVVVVLLVSIDSATVCPPSASTIRYRVAVGAPAGIVTCVEPALLLPLPRTPTGRLPINVSPGSKPPRRAYYLKVVDAAAGPVPKFCVVSVTVMVDPGSALEGAES